MKTTNATARIDSFWAILWFEINHGFSAGTAYELPRIGTQTKFGKIDFPYMVYGEKEAFDRFGKENSSYVGIAMRNSTKEKMGYYFDHFVQKKDYEKTMNIIATVARKFIRRCSTDKSLKLLASHFYKQYKKEEKKQSRRTKDYFEVRDMAIDNVRNLFSKKILQTLSEIKTCSWLHKNLAFAMINYAYGIIVSEPTLA